MTIESTITFQELLDARPPAMDHRVISLTAKDLVYCSIWADQVWQARRLGAISGDQLRDLFMGKEQQ